METNTRDMLRMFVDARGSIFELRAVTMPGDTRSGDYVLVDHDCLALYLHTHTPASACIALADKTNRHRAADKLPQHGNIFEYIQA